MAQTGFGRFRGEPFEVGTHHDGMSSPVLALRVIAASLPAKLKRRSRPSRGEPLPAHGHGAARINRAAFLLSFATRIGQRLAEINDALVAETEHDTGRSVLPVLLDRQTIVDDALEERFGEMRSQSVRGGNDAAGWVNGRLAADQAQLNFAEFDRGAPTLRDSGRMMSGQRMTERRSSSTSRHDVTSELGPTLVT